MEDLIEKLYPGYNQELDFEELLEDINDIDFLMKCRYYQAEYPIKQIKTSIEEKYNIEELYITPEEKVQKDLLKQLNEKNLDEIMMNIESRGSNNNQGKQHNQVDHIAGLILENH